MRRWLLLLLIAVPVLAQEYRPLNVELMPSEYHKGAFAVPLAERVLPDPEAEARLQEIMRWRQLQKRADKALLAVGGDACFVYIDQHDAEYVGVLLAFIGQYASAEASLTAVLLVAADGRDSSGPWDEPMLEALRAMCATYPDTWQSHVAPLIEARIVGWSARPDRTSAELAQLRILTEAMPDAEYALPLRNSVVAAFLRQEAIELPLRAHYLEAIASTHYSLAYARGFPLDTERLEAAAEAYQRLIGEYPDGPHAERARRDIQQVARLQQTTARMARELGDEEGRPPEGQHSR